MGYVPDTGYMTALEQIEKFGWRLFADLVFLQTLKTYPKASVKMLWKRYQAQYAELARDKLPF